MKDKIHDVKRRAGITLLAGAIALTQLFYTFPAAALGKPDYAANDVFQLLINQVTTELAPGITERHFTFKNPNQKRSECFSVDVKLGAKSNTQILVGTPNDGEEYGMQTVRDQANAAKTNGKNVVAAINADFYNMATGEPQGVVVKDGKEIHKNGSENFFAIKKNGTAIIGTSKQYEQEKDDIQEAIGCGPILVNNGKAVESNDGPYPYVGIGIRDDNSVFMACVDGAQPQYSEGFTQNDLAHLLVVMGAVWGAKLDGGGSATYVSRTPGESELSCKNSPSDGWERKVANSLLVVSDIEPDGKFASAYVTPQDKTYMPKSSVQMKAAGIDQSGAPANCPDKGLTWSLSDSSFGTIDKDGLLTSSGKTGQVQINLAYDGKKVGSTNIEFAVPDEFKFKGTSLSVGINGSKPLDLAARYQGRDVIIDKSVLKWDVPDTLGSVDGDGVFHAGKGSTSGSIKVSLLGTKLSSKIDIIVGQPPSVVCDFEDPNKYSTSTWYTHYGKRKETCSFGGLSTYPDEPTRFGNHALKFNFDFTTGQSDATLTTYVGPQANIDIPGTPTAIGMWVYATPEAYGEWLWTGIYDKNGNKAIGNGKDYLVSQETGIDWTGWKYLEAPIKSDAVFPIHIGKGVALGVLCVKSGQISGCPMTKGSVYVDNIRAVYGTTNDDTTSPVIDSVTTDGKTYGSSAVDISAYVHDAEQGDNYGINWDRSTILVDGKDYSSDEEHYSYDKTGELEITGIKWGTGSHKVTVDIQDNFGNETTEDSYFTVKDPSAPSVELTSDKTATLGKNHTLKLIANHLSKIKNINVKVKLSKQFNVNENDITFTSVKGTSSYDKETGVLSLDITNTSDEDAKKEIAEIDIPVPTNLKESDKFQYSVEDSSIEYKTDQIEDFVSTFSQEPTTANIISDYKISMNKKIIGQRGEILVTDRKGTPVSGASVILLGQDGKENKNLGVTTEKGTINNVDLESLPEKFNLQANKDASYSFILPFQTYKPVKDTEPSNIIVGTSEDPMTQKTITWMSNPLSSNKAVIKYDLDEAKVTEGNASTTIGTSKTLYYDTDSSAVQENSVKLTGLKPGAQYYYQIGDGTNWSSIKTTSTAPADTKNFNFYVFGDTQSTETNGLDSLGKVITGIESAKPRPLFNLHVGDFIDDAQVFDEIDQTEQMFNKHSIFNTIDMIHVLGNHEYQGDDGSKSALIYGVPQNGPEINKYGCYSTNYGNMHISVIGWTSSRDTMEKELDWLKQDVRSAHKTWNIVATHQPAFNKNPGDPLSIFHDMLPPVCDELGIDLVFSGHDHSYGRTYPLLYGKQVSDGKGTVYISAGHTAEKTYDIVPDDPSVFAKVQENKDDKTYIKVSVNDNKLTVNAYKDDGTQVDTYSVTAGQHLDKSELLSTIDRAKSFDSSKYTQESWKELSDALKTAEMENTDSDASQNDIDKAMQDLENAIKGLKLNTTKSIEDTIDKLGNNPSSEDVTTTAKAVLTLPDSDRKNLSSESVDKLNNLLAQNKELKTDTSISMVSEISENNQIPQKPSAKGLLLAAGINGSEENANIKLDLKQIPQKEEKAIVAFQLSLSKDNKTIEPQVPVTLTFKFPVSFHYDILKKYEIIHCSDNGTSTVLTLNIDGNSKDGYTGTFTTPSFSYFTVIAEDKPESSEGHNGGSGGGSGDSNTGTELNPVTQTQPSQVQTTYISDTAHDFSVNETYQFKITSKNGKAPTFVIGTPGVFEIESTIRNGNDYFIKLRAIGAPGDKAGIYINGGPRLLVATVGSNPNYAKLDTGKQLSVRSGKTYQFRVTATKKPTFVCGTGSTFRVGFAGSRGNDYFFKVTATGKVGDRAGFYVNREKVPRTVGMIIS